ncbi:hypothetical protein ACVOMT_23945 (plasmid) [Sphingomonas panni]
MSVCPVAIQILRTARNGDHRASAPITAVTNAGDAPAAMRTTAPANSTTTASPVPGPARGSGATVTAAKPDTARLISRRHRYIWLARKSACLAISPTLAPGSHAAKTSPRFCSAVHIRRLSTPKITVT